MKRCELDEITFSNFSFSLHFNTDDHRCLSISPAPPPTLATCSSHLPSAMNTKSMGGVSKKVVGLFAVCSNMDTIRMVSE